MKLSSTVTALVAILTLNVGAALADGNPPEVDDGGRADYEIMRQQVAANRQAVVAENLKLDDDQAKEFWPLYREFHMHRDELSDRRVNALEEFYENYDKLSEKQAKTLLNDHMDLRQDRLALDKKYITKFRRILSEKHTLRYFQIENKLDAVIEDELVQVIPLAP